MVKKFAAGNHAQKKLGRAEVGGGGKAAWDSKFDNMMALRGCPVTKKVVQEKKKVVQEQKKFFEKIGK